jgi:alanine racemase
VEIDAAALRANLAHIRKAAGDAAAVVPMIKANAYGLGVRNTVVVLEAEEPDGYGVATVEEGLEVRALGVERPVLVMTPPPASSLAAALDGGLTLCFSDLDSLRALTAEAVRRRGRATFHMEVDTGMGRAGLDWRSAEVWGREVAALAAPPLRWGGCYTHFHSADEAAGTIDRQWARLQEAVGHLSLPADAWVHVCNSAAVLRRPQYAASAVRPGIFLYGGASAPDLPRPAPVVAVRARITLVRDVPTGSSLGYGATHVARRPERWATVAIGYGDGLPRALGNRGHALVRGQRVPLVGRTSMDVTVVEISRVPDARAGDIVTFIGSDRDEEITVEEVADQAGTINYEVLTGLTGRLPRIWQA